MCELRCEAEDVEEGKLTSRVVIFSNELLRLQDESGALPGRFLTFRMQQSFYGREDANLTDKLLAERSGILNVGLNALDRIRARDKLVQCQSGEEMYESLGELASDVSGFVEECCVLGPDQQILCKNLFGRWQMWCVLRGVRHVW